MHAPCVCPSGSGGAALTAGGLGDGPRVFENVLDGHANLVVVDENDVVDHVAAESQSLDAGGLDRHAVGKGVDALQQRLCACPTQGLEEREGGGGDVKLQEAECWVSD